VPVWKDSHTIVSSILRLIQLEDPGLIRSVENT
jgi:hypothetical protein